MKKKLIFLTAILLLLASCVGGLPATPQPGAVDTIVAQTIAAWTASAPASTSTLVPTDTAQPTASPVPTETIPPPSDTPAAPLPTGAKCIPNNTEQTEAQVTRVIDGDTIEGASLA